MRQRRLGLDVLGGDHPPEAFIPVLAAALEATVPSWRLVLFATSQLLESFRSGPYGPYLEHPALDVILTREILGMEDTPLHAVRHKRASSLVQGVTKLKEGNLDAFISIGNTGALVAAATLQLSTLPGVRRLSLLAEVPTQRGSAAILDVGATLDPTPEDLVIWSELGAQHLLKRRGIDSPKLGLLNIGKEPYKGTSLQKNTYKILSQPNKLSPSIRFIGNVESQEIYEGAVDLVITDGYTGNIFLKTSEAASAFTRMQMQRAFSILPEKGNFDLYLSAVQSAYLLGTAFTLIKCHGAMSPNLLPNVIQEVQKA